MGQLKPTEEWVKTHSWLPLCNLYNAKDTVRGFIKGCNQLKQMLRIIVEITTPNIHPEMYDITSNTNPSQANIVVKMKLS